MELVGATRYEWIGPRIPVAGETHLNIGTSERDSLTIAKLSLSETAHDRIVVTRTTPRARVSFREVPLDQPNPASLQARFTYIKGFDPKELVIQPGRELQLKTVVPSQTEACACIATYRVFFNNSEYVVQAAPVTSVPYEDVLTFE